MSADEERRALLNALLLHASFDGWTDRALRHAAADIGRREDDLRLLFPGGMRDVLAFYLRDLDRQLEEAAADMNLSDLKIRARIHRLVKERILLLAPHREAARRASLALTLPNYADIAAGSLWRTVDLMWRLAGDQATDWNYYTKRAILSGVYSATLLYWFSDHSDNFWESWAFLERRIDDVMSFEKLKAECRKATEGFPSPARILGRLRHRSAPSFR